jgi:hypothetical protein
VAFQGSDALSGRAVRNGQADLMAAVPHLALEVFAQRPMQFRSISSSLAG